MPNPKKPSAANTRSASSKKTSGSRPQDKGLPHSKYTDFVIDFYLDQEHENVPPLRSARANKGKGGKAEQLNSLHHALQPGEFGAPKKPTKTYKKKAPESAPVNPMAPQEKLKRASRV